MPTDHLNVVERELIDNLRTGTYSGGTAWSEGDVAVFGQFPDTEDVKYPCIILQMLANGIEQQFVGKKITSNGSSVIGELYGVGFNMHIGVDKESSMTVVWEDATCDTTNTNTTVTCDNTSQFSAGTTVSGSGIAAGTTIASVTNSTSFVLSAAATATATNATLTFSNPYKQRRLLNYLMNNCANVLMDCDFTSTDTEVVQRLYMGFRNVGYERSLEVWAAVTGMAIVFKNTRG